MAIPNLRGCSDADLLVAAILGSFARHDGDGSYQPDDAAEMREAADAELRRCCEEREKLNCRPGLTVCSKCGEETMDTKITITVYAATSKNEALSRFAPIVEAMGVAHAEHLRIMISESDQERAKHYRALARKNLEAQMCLGQIELFIHNLPDT